MRGPFDAAFVKSINDAGMGLYVYTVNDAAEAKRLEKMGVKGVTTDRPADARTIGGALKASDHGAARQFSRFFELLLWALLANGLVWVWFYGGLTG
ncbi:MAG: glycerophosphodiester phosphodiesterase family protein [Bryobacterales bacterium]